MQETPPATVKPRAWMQLLSHPAVRIVIPIVGTGLALFVLHRMSTEISLAEVKTDARAIRCISLRCRWARCASAILRCPSTM